MDGLQPSGTVHLMYFLGNSQNGVVLALRAAAEACCPFLPSQQTMDLIERQLPWVALGTG